MNELARTIQAKLPKTHGFALLVFDFNAEGRMSYVSNGTREDMHKALRELLDHWEADDAGRRS